MNITTIINVVTIVISYILGLVSKKSKYVNNNFIPLQNILIGLTVAIIEWIITKDFKMSIALSGIIAGGTYDVFHNLEKMIERKKDNE